MREAFAEKHNMYLREMADDALLGLAREYKDSDLTDVEIYQEVRGRIYTAVMAHELGHSLGLMHNFGASDDKISSTGSFVRLTVRWVHVSITQ